MFRDLQNSWRLLTRARGFALTAIATLALGIGATTAIFSVVDAAVLRPLPYPDPDRLVVLSYFNSDGRRTTGAPPRAFLDWRERQQVFESLAAVMGGAFVIAGDGEPEEIRPTTVTADFFAMYGAQPIIGRVFGREAESPGSHRVVVLGHGFWQRRFGGASDVVGKFLQTDKGNYEIVGVLAADFRYPAGRSTSSDVFVPLAFSEEDRTYGVIQSGFLSCAARLKPGVSLEEAAAQMTALEASFADRRHARNQNRAVVLTSMHEDLTGESRQWMLMLLGAVAFVLLIACANVANLFLVHGADRVRELTVRSALGAGPWRLARQMLAESVVISILGAAAGLVLAWWGVVLLRAAVPTSIPRWATIALDLRAVACATLAASLTAIVCGVLPAWRAARLDVAEGMKDGARGATIGRGRMRLGRGLAFAEVAGALILLVGAGLFIASMTRLLLLDPGFDTKNVVAMSIDIPDSIAPSGRAGFAAEVVRRVSAVPGVTGAAMSQNSRAFGGGYMSMPFRVEGQAVTAERESIIVRTVTPEYLPLLGVRILKGRHLEDTDTSSSTLVGVVNEATARRFFGGTDPVGQRLVFNKATYEIVGVANDMRHRGPAVPPVPELFIPFAQADAFSSGTLTIRIAGEQAPVIAAVKSCLFEMVPGRPIDTIESLETSAWRQSASRRFNMLLMTIFGVLALAIAATGVYGVMAYIVRLRTHEIGVRVALGATAADVSGLIVKQGALSIGLGLVVGLAGAWYLARTVQSFLFEVQARDPLVFVGAATILGVVGFVACWLPARRAARVDPLVALRSE